MRRWGRFGLAAAFASAIAVAACVDFGALSGGEDGGVVGSDASSDGSIASDADGGQDASSTDVGDGCTPFTAPPTSACTLTGACPISIVSSKLDAGDTYPLEIAVDDANIFIAATDDYNGHAAGVIERISKTGSGAREVIARAQNEPYGVTVDGTYVYWVNQGQLDAGPPSVWRIAKNATACASFGCAAPSNVYEGAAGPTLQFVRDVGDDEVFIIGSFLMHLKLTGATWTQGPSFSVQPNPELFIDPQSAYFVQAETSEIDVVSRAGDTKTVFTNFPDDAGVRHVASDCTDVYALANTGIQIVRFSKTSKVPSPVQSLPAGLNPYQMAIDDTFLYVVSADGPGVYRIRKDGTAAPQQIIAGNVWALAQDDSAVYWTDHTDGAVHKFTK